MPTGVYVSEVISGGAAQKAGISKGAVITGLDGTEIDSMSTDVYKRQGHSGGGYSRTARLEAEQSPEHRRGDDPLYGTDPGSILIRNS